MLYSRSKGPSAEPVTNEEYAIQIGRDWNVKESGSGFVTRFFVRKAFMGHYPIQTVGGTSGWTSPAIASSKASMVARARAYSRSARTEVTPNASLNGFPRAGFHDLNSLLQPAVPASFFTGGSDRLACTPGTAADQTLATARRPSAEPRHPHSPTVPRRHRSMLPASVDRRDPLW